MLDSEANKWAAILHISLLAGHLVPFGGFVVPLIIWQVNKDTIPGLDSHGREAMNWIISCFLYYLGFGMMAVFFFFFSGSAFLLMLCALGLLALVGLVFPIVAAIKASDGEVWKYPGALTIF